MTWTAARNLIKSLGAGASMYVINDKAEETAVYNKLLASVLDKSKFSKTFKSSIKLWNNAVFLNDED